MFLVPKEQDCNQQFLAVLWNVASYSFVDIPEDVVFTKICLEDGSRELDHTDLRVL